MRDAREGRHSANGTPILGANGAPTKLNFAPFYQPGFLATPVTLPPIQDGANVVLPIFGGETRMERVASRLLANAMAHNTLERCGQEPDYRRRMIDAAVVTAWELIATATTYTGPQAPAGEAEDDNPPTIAAEGSASDERPQDETTE